MEIDHANDLKRTDDQHRKMEAINDQLTTKQINHYKAELAKSAKRVKLAEQH